MKYENSHATDTVGAPANQVDSESEGLVARAPEYTGSMRGSREDAVDFGELLRRHRMAAQLSQEELAERSHVSAKAISALERGARRAPYRETVLQLSRALDLKGSDSAAFEASAIRARMRKRLKPDTPYDELNSGIPRPATSFVGREAEVADIVNLLRDRRLVSIIGSGGIGKTRVALEVCRRVFSEGASGLWFVDLSTTSDEDDVLAKIAVTLGVPSRDVTPQRSAIISFARNLTALIVLDTCEHVIGAVTDVVAELMRQCPCITVLTTSRQRLAVDGEMVYQLPPLSVPATDVTSVREARDFPAVDLFEQRAAAAVPGFVITEADLPVVSAICRRLDGIPLTIELAAARLPLFGLPGLEAQLSNHLQAVTGGRHDTPARQQTLVAMLRWSWELLNEIERTVFRRLAIFVGGWRLEAAEYVCADARIDAAQVGEALSSLAEKSLVVVNAERDTAHYALLETTRFYALERLAEAKERAGLLRRHASWFADFADRVYSTNGKWSRQRWVQDQMLEYENALAAVDWAFGVGNDAVVAGRLISGFRGCWLSAGRMRQQQEWAREALRRIGVIANTELRGRLHALLAYSVSGKESQDHAQIAIPLLEQAQDWPAAVMCYGRLAAELFSTGHRERALSGIATADAIVRRERLLTDNRENICAYLAYKFVILGHAGRTAEATALGEECLAMAEEFDDFWAIMSVQMALAEIAFRSGDTETAIRRASSGLRRGHRVRNRFSEAILCANLAGYNMSLGQCDEALAFARQALTSGSADGTQVAFWCITHIAAAAALRGDAPRAARLLGYVNAGLESKEWVMTENERASCEVLKEAVQRQLGDSASTYEREGAQFSSERAKAEAIGVALSTTLSPV